MIVGFAWVKVQRMHDVNEYRECELLTDNEFRYCVYIDYLLNVYDNHKDST